MGFVEVIMRMCMWKIGIWMSYNYKDTGYEKRILNKCN